MNELLEEFQGFRKILCVCPCCGELVRVSDLKLKVKGAGVSVGVTWLDEFERKVQAFNKKEIDFDEKEKKIRAKSVEAGRKAAETAIKKMMSPQLKAMKLDPYDIKPISNPVDFVVFRGMYKSESISDIMFLSKYLANSELNVLRQQVSKAVAGKQYAWQVARIDESGVMRVE